MEAMKFLGIIVVFQLFVARDAFGQNFYPARYGKREENDFEGESPLEGKRLGRSNEHNTITDRKIRFFISGGRYGKRGCSSEKCSQRDGEMISSGFDTDRESSDRIRLPIRKNQFMMGSRFGKRFGDSTSKDESSIKDPWCRFVSEKELLGCSFRPLVKA